jgi:hypothetical protein
MGFVGVPPKNEYKDIPADIYEVYVGEITEVENRFYDPAKDKPVKKTQYKFSLIIRDDDNDLMGSRLTYWTPAYIGASDRNKLTSLVKILDPKFNIDVCYDTEDDFFKAVQGQPLRVTTVKVEKENGDTFTKVSGILPSKLGKPTTAELVKIMQGADNPF